MCGGFVGDLIDDATDLAEDTWDTIEDTGGDILDTTMPITLDIVTLGNGDSAWYILSGDKYRDEKRLEEKAAGIEDMSRRITSLQDRLSNKVFLEQIFKYGDIRRIKDLGTSYEQLTKEYEALLSDYRNNQDGNFLVSITNFIPNVLASLVYNVLDYIKTGDTASLRTAISIAVIIVATAAAVMSGQLGFLGTLLTVLASILTLDSMVNNSGLLGSAFRILDIILNKVLQADSVLNTEGFDRDSHYYQTMMDNTRLAVQISAIAVSIHTAFTKPDLGTAAGRMAARNANFGAYAGGTASGQTLAMQTTTLQTSAGIAGANGSDGIIQSVKNATSYKIGGVVSLSDLYDAYNTASKANDAYGAFSLKKDLSDRLTQEQDKLQKKINKDNRRKMEGSYSDAAYLANQTDMSYHSYVLQMSEAGQTDVFDPQGTIVMNTRYHPVKSYMFGFEDMFEYDGMAGGQMYVYNTLWK